MPREAKLFESAKGVTLSRVIYASRQHPAELDRAGAPITQESRAFYRPRDEEAASIAEDSTESADDDQVGRPGVEGSAQGLGDRLSEGVFLQRAAGVAGD